ncbi:MAG: DUF814 domain-containing protein, partial [Calditrichaeota bacterium]|nr:DUF814 domain-containing protein [Calditrichota bacterium]
LSPGVLSRLATELTKLASGADVQNALQQDEELFRLVLADGTGLFSLVLSLLRNWPGVFLDPSVPRKLQPARDFDFSPVLGMTFRGATASEATLSLVFSGPDESTTLLEFRLGKAQPVLALRQPSEKTTVPQEETSVVAVDSPAGSRQALSDSSRQTPGQSVLVCYRSPDAGPPQPVQVRLENEGCPPNSFAKVFTSANEAVRTFVFHGLHRHRFEQLKALLEKTFRKQLKKVKRRIQNLQQDLKDAQSADRYREFANLLLANPGDNQRGHSSVTLPTFDGSTTVTVPLDPTKTPVENAEAYYRKARKLEAKRKIATERLEQARAEMERLENLLRKVRETDSLKALQELANNEAPEVLQGKKVQRTAKAGSRASQGRRAFLEFTSADGLQILAGRSAEDNEKLTFDVAKEHDFWFHAAGTTGSHVIVRNPQRLEKCPPRTAEQAAALAAYLSKNRNSSNVLVHYTQKRYLKKAKGAPPGTVIMKTFQSMFVKPALPEQTKDASAAGS